MASQTKINLFLFISLILLLSLSISGCLSYSTSPDFNNGSLDGYNHPNEEKLNNCIERLNKKIDIYNLRNTDTISHINIIQKEVDLLNYNGTYQTEFYLISYGNWDNDRTLNEFEDHLIDSTRSEYYDTLFDSQDHYALGYITGYQLQKNDQSQTEKIAEIENQISLIEKDINNINT